jgi:hypothetical protein
MSEPKTYVFVCCECSNATPCYLQVVNAPDLVDPPWLCPYDNKDSKWQIPKEGE